MQINSGKFSKKHFGIHPTSSDFLKNKSQFYIGFSKTTPRAHFHLISVLKKYLYFLLIINAGFKYIS
jgi:hypothetical protein